MKAGYTFVAVMALASPAFAVTFTPTFDVPSFPGTQFDVGSDPAYNEYYEENFGLTVENAYLYVDPRDTFDGIGIANGLAAANGNPNEAGRINFIDTTDFVELSYSSVLTGGTYAAYSASGSLIDSFSTGNGTSNGVEVFEGDIISYILFSGQGGAVGISGLTYNYDGDTDGTNDDLDVVNPGGGGDGVSPVPLPASGLLMIFALGGAATLRRRRG